MRKILHTLLLAAALFGVAPASAHSSAAPSPASATRLNASSVSRLPQLSTGIRTALGISEEGTRPCVIDFWATWCAPCLAFSPRYEALKKEYAGKADLVSCDYDRNRSIAQTYAIRMLPTVIVFDHNGNPVEMFEYGPADSQLRSILDELIERQAAGIEAPESDDSSVAEYYTLDGIRVDNPTDGLYIRRTGARSELRLIRK